MNNLSAASQLIGITRLFGRGAYTNDPADPNYPKHQHSEDIRPHETLQQVYPASIGARGLRTYGTVRQTDTGVYFDPARLPNVGSVGRVGNAALSFAGLNASRRYEADAVEVESSAPNRLTFRTPDGLEALARTDGYIGAPADLPPLEQAKNAWRFFRG